MKEYPDIVKKILILDLDVHQGNGNSVLFQNNTKVFTFSMHCRQNYFSAKQFSNVDIELDEGTTDEKYLSKLRTWLPYLLDVVKPNLIFFQAGVDIYRNDRLGRLDISREGIRKRNCLVYRIAKRKGVHMVVTMGGGYPKDSNVLSGPFNEIVQCHADVYRDCIDTFSP